MTKHQWFESWFDTDYYHLLYQHRDASEAELFIQRLVRYLKPAEGSSFCDLACGNGRHAEVIAQMGYDVTGLDLSPNNIEMARELPDDRLQFFVHDMREPFGIDKYDFVLNLFTSFGYFETDEDHLKVLQNISNSLKQNGRTVIDFLNVNHVKRELIHSSEESHDGIDFHIRRIMDDKHIIKEIKVVDNGRTHYYEERVRKFELEDFDRMLNKSNLRISEAFGGYDLTPYSEDESNRLIIIADKI